MSLRAALKQASVILAEAGVETPAVDARLIAAHLAGIAPLEILFHEQVPPGFWEAIERRATREPLQHILGTAPFGALELAVGPGVFIPRPETEVLAQWGLGQLSLIDAARGQHLRQPGPLRAVDLCTGSAALALALGQWSSTLPGERGVEIVGVEKQESALGFAQRNLAANPPRPGNRIELLPGDATDPHLLAAWHGQVDLVVSNPPYVPLTDDLQPEVYADPPEAVFAGDSGMEIIVPMLDVIARLLRPGGRVGVEHDDSTSELVQEAFVGHGGFAEVEVVDDLSGTARFVTASKLAK